MGSSRTVILSVKVERIDLLVILLCDAVAGDVQVFDEILMEFEILLLLVRGQQIVGNQSAVKATA